MTGAVVTPCIGVCVQTSADLAPVLQAHPAVIHAAPVLTENLGLEKLVATIVANPAFRFVVICGAASEKLVGQAIVALHQNGVEPAPLYGETEAPASDTVYAAARRRIIGARGPRPIIVNLSTEEIAHFQRQVEIIDLDGVTGVAAITTALDTCAARNPGAFTAPPPRPLIEPIAAWHDPIKEWYPDKTGFFLVIPDHERQIIILEHYSMQMQLLHKITGTTSADLTHTAIREGLVTELHHAAYLGRETAKAEAALRFGLKYEQDSPLERL